MYFFELFANIFKKKNFGVLVWLIINTIIVTFCFTVLIDIATGSVLDDWLEYLLGFIAYMGTLAIALSPVGETILRWQNRCEKITDKETLLRLEKLFEEVRKKSVEFDESLNRKIKLYMSDDECLNAFATGRKTVCITKGLLALDDDEIKGVLAHEFGHLSHKDTDVILFIAVGNMFVSIAVSVISLIIRIINWIIGIIFSMFTNSERGGFIVGFLTAKFNALVSVIFAAVLWLWTKLGIIICMTSSRQNEFYADKFAFEIGLGKELRSALARIDGGEKIKSKGLWAALNASHPNTDIRIEKLDSYSVSPVNCERDTMAVPYLYNETDVVTPPASNKELVMFRGFSSNFGNNAEFNEEVFVSAKKEEILDTIIEETETASSNLTLGFHKANIYIIIPVTIILTIIGLITKGIDILNDGLDLINTIGVISGFTIALFSASAFFDFRKRSSSAFIETMIVRITSIISSGIIFIETFANSTYVFDDLVVIIALWFSVVFDLVITVLFYVYYKKRKEFLFDNTERIQKLN